MKLNCVLLTSVAVPTFYCVCTGCGKTTASVKNQESASVQNPHVTANGESQFGYSIVIDEKPGIRPDLFDPINPPPPPPAKTIAPVKQPPVIVMAPEPVDPLAGVIFKGISELNGESYALLEDAKTGEGTFVKIGDSFRGVTVTSLDKDFVRYKSDSGDRQLAMNTNYSLVPLSKGAVSADNPKIADVLESTVRDRLVATRLNYVTFAQPGGISNEKAQNLQSQVFDGKISQKEAARQGLGAPANNNSQFVTFGDVVLSNSNVKFNAVGVNGSTFSITTDGATNPQASIVISQPLTFTPSGK
ncbi:MAG: hypothetical protein ABJA67_01145 [Chthonomonadales bacterium]